MRGGSAAPMRAKWHTISVGFMRASTQRLFWEKNRIGVRVNISFHSGNFNHYFWPRCRLLNDAHFAHAKVASFRGAEGAEEEHALRRARCVRIVL
jgi:hypothetical protein